MSSPSILVLFNQPVLPRDHPEYESEVDVLETVGDVVKVLSTAGFAVRKLGISFDPQPLLDEIKQSRPDAVFNLFEVSPRGPATEIGVAALLEWLDVAFTGCPSSMSGARPATRTGSKHLLAGAGLPTAKYLVVEGEPIPSGRTTGQRWSSPPCKTQASGSTRAAW